MKRLDEISETVEKKEMPLDSYLWMYGDAKLSDAQRKLIMAWAAKAKTQLSNTVAVSK